MRILLVGTDPAGRDGWSAYLRILRAGLVARGMEVSVVSLPHPLSYLTNPFLAPLRAPALRRTIHQWNPDIIHFTAEPYAALLPWMPASAVLRSVVTLHGSYGVRMFQGVAARRRSCRNVHQVPAWIAVSNYTKQRVLREAGICCGHESAQMMEPRIQVVYTGVDTPDVERAEDRPAIKRVICVGEVKPRKGILEAVEGFAAYRRLATHPAVFSVIGAYDESSSYYKKVQHRIQELGCADAVRFTGSVTDHELAEHYRSADVFLMPAKTTSDTFEGFGLVFLEAAHRGIPCIGPVESGAGEAIREGVSGYKVDPERPEEIAGALTKILDEHRIAPDACRAWAGRFTLSAMIDAVESVYSRLLP